MATSLNRRVTDRDKAPLISIEVELPEVIESPISVVLPPENNHLVAHHHCRVTCSRTRLVSSHDQHFLPFVLFEVVTVNVVYALSVQLETSKYHH